MAIQIVECSPKAKRRIKSYSDEVGTKLSKEWASFPFNELNIGQAFILPLDEASESSLRSQASIVGKRENKRFAVLKHNANNPLGVECLEVARIQ